MLFQTIKSQLLALSVIPVVVLSVIFAVSYTIVQVNLLSKIHLDYGSTLVKNIGPSSEFGILTNNKNL